MISTKTYSLINIDVKKLFLNTHATVKVANLTPTDSPALAPILKNISADVKISPWVVGVEVGYELK